MNIIPDTLTTLTLLQKHSKSLKSETLPLFDGLPSRYLTLDFDTSYTIAKIIIDSLKLDKSFSKVIPKFFFLRKGDYLLPHQASKNYNNTYVLWIALTSSISSSGLVVQGINKFYCTLRKEGEYIIINGDIWTWISPSTTNSRWFLRLTYI